MKKLLIFVILSIIIFPSVKFLFHPGYFNMHDDLQVMRTLEMDKCLSDGQIPCRWSPDMAYGYGQAMFNYYSVFPYYLGSLLRIIFPFTIIGTVKLLFIISLVGGAIGMFLLAREFWGTWGGILSAVLYTYAPYHFLDVYIRGALSESFALAILPFIWLTFYLLIKRTNYYNLIATSLALAALLITHNISTIIYTPFTVLWVIYWLVRSKNWKSVKFILVSGLLGLGLSSFFFIPAIFEQSIIQTHTLTLDYYDFRAHFVTLNQLFIKRIWETDRPYSAHMMIYLLQ